MEALDRKREIPVSSCPTQFEHQLYSGQHLTHTPSEESMFGELLLKLDENGPPLKRTDRPKQRKDAPHKTRFHQITGIRAEHPGFAFEFCYVDTDNVFTFKGVRHQINYSVPAYQQVETKQGVLYDVDHILVLHNRNGCRHFYTPQLAAIEPHMVTVI